MTNPSTPQELAEQAGWRDVGARARNLVRGQIRHGHLKARAVAGEGASIEELRRDAARVPEEYFICSNCGTGPWHVNWGGICGNCSGAA